MARPAIGPPSPWTSTVWDIVRGGVVLVAAAVRLRVRRPGVSDVQKVVVRMDTPPGAESHGCCTTTPSACGQKQF